MDGVIRGVKNFEGAGVTEGRLQVYSFDVPDTLVEAFKGNAFNANTKAITLTSGSESAVAYLRNSEDKPIVLARVGYLFGNSTGGSGDLSMLIVKNPTGGTIIDNAVAMPVNANRNTGKSDTIDVTVYKGVEGDTLTGGVEIFPSLLTGTQGYVVPTDLVINKGESIGVLITPQTGNTSMNVYVFLNYYLLDLTKQVVE